MKIPFFDQPKGRNLFEDQEFWSIPDEQKEGRVQNGAPTQEKLLNETTQSEDKV